MHVVGHLHADDSHTHPIGDVKHVHPHVDVVTQTTVTSDCSAFHAFAGMSGLLPVDCTSVANHSAFAPVKIRTPLVLVAISIDAEPIRGPPAFS